MNTFDILRQTRKNILAVIEDLTLEQLNKVPAGFNNSLLWNFGHILVTQQALTYRLSGLQTSIDSEIVNKLKKGTKASDYSDEMFDYIKTNFFSLVDATEQDYSAGKFTNFTEYPTSYGITLHNIEDAFTFNNAHEALHLGYMMALKRNVLQ